MDLKSKFERLLKLYFQFQSAKEIYSYLKKVIPPCMSERMADKPADKRLLISSIGWYDAKTEAIYAKALEALGYETYVVTRWDPFVAKIFTLFGVKNIFFYHDYGKNASLRKIRNEAGLMMKDINKDDALGLSRSGISVGKYAASSFMRFTRSSELNLDDKSRQSLFTEQLVRSLRAAIRAEEILEDVKPDLLLVNDRGYTPVGQLFDVCLAQNIPVIQRCGSHKSGSEVLKRYSSPQMSCVHHHSLSEESQEETKNMPWGEETWLKLYGDLERIYGSGDWFSEVGTQFNKTIYSKGEIVSKLNLCPDKKTAIVFAHMFWDATFFWGEDLFKDYYDWFVNVLRIANQNKNLNWIIKIHPANTVKAKRDNYRGKHKELAAVYEALGEVPEHIKIIPPESDINTFSLFGFMDYCLTVRGTIGIEASAFGISTLTAGTGRYDRLGFTYDFNSQEEYINCLKHLEDLSPMTPAQIELARRYAYGAFILRPIHLDILECGYQQDDKATMKFRPLFKNRIEFERSGFVKKFRDFVLSEKEDFLNIELLSKIKEKNRI